MRLSKFFKNWWRRASAASKTGALLALCVFAAKVYVVVFTLWMATAKITAWSGPGARAFWVFVFALGITTVQPYLPKRVSTKWIVEDVRRNLATGVAVSGITSAIWNRQLRPEQKHDLFVRLLSAIKSEVEGITGDNEGIYFNVSLLSLDENGGTLTVVCRANPDRPLRSYRVVDMLVSQTLSTGKMFYEPDCKLADKPYKAILGIPLVSVHENCKPLVHGIVSIDSAQAHCFDGLLEDIENKILMYISILKLVITADEALRRGGGRQNERKR
jgi:hypothetical protein